VTTLIDEAGGVVNQRKLAPIDGEHLERPPKVDSFGGINQKHSKRLDYVRISLVPVGSYRFSLVWKP